MLTVIIRVTTISSLMQFKSVPKGLFAKAEYFQASIAINVPFLLLQVEPKLTCAYVRSGQDLAVCICPLKHH